MRDRWREWLHRPGRLPLRQRQHSANAMEVARFLKGHPLVSWVSYPGLAEHVSHALAKKYLGGNFGALYFTNKALASSILNFVKVQNGGNSSAGGAEVIVDGVTMKITNSIINNSATDGLLKLNGALDMNGTYAIEVDFVRHCAGERVRVLVDLSKVNYISSIGIPMLVNSAKSVIKHGGKMVLLNPQESVEYILELAGVPARQRRSDRV